MNSGMLDYLLSVSIVLAVASGLCWLGFAFVRWSAGEDKEAADNAAIERLARDSLRTDTVQHPTRDCTEIMARVYRDYSEREYQR